MQRNEERDKSAPFAIVGFGQMGGNLARQAFEKDLQVVGMDARGVADELVSVGVIPGRSFAEVALKLSPPCIAVNYVPAGAVDAVLNELYRHFSPGDVVVEMETPTEAIPFGAGGAWRNSVPGSYMRVEVSIPVIAQSVSQLRVPRRQEKLVAGDRDDAARIRRASLRTRTDYRAQAKHESRRQLLGP